MLRRCAVLFVVFNGLLFTPLYAWGQNSPNDIKKELNELHSELDQFQNKLEKTQRKKKKARKKLRKAAQKERTILGLIERYNDQMDYYENRLSRLKKMEKDAKRKLAEVEKKLENTRVELNDRKQLLSNRLRSMYRQGQLMHSNLLMNIQNTENLVTRLRYYREIVGMDKSIIKDYRSTQTRLEELKGEREHTLSLRRNLREKVQNTIREKKSLLAKRKRILDKIRNKKELYTQKVRELEDQQSKMKNIVVKLQQKKSIKKNRLKRMTHQFGRRKGELPWPVDSNEILHPFGSWTKNGIVHQNDGIDIEVKPGSKVRAVAPGKVVFAQEYQGMGKVVILRHSGKYLTLYGSLVESYVKEGDELDAGGSIGRAGETSAFETPRLYFQVFKGRSILNPSEWLASK